MNVINRLIVSLGAVALISAGIYILLLISGTLDPGDINGEFFVPQIERIAADVGADLWADVGIAIGFIAAGIAVLILQLASPGRGRGGRTVLLSDDERGYVRISVQSIRELTERTSYGVRSVVDASCSVKVTPGGLRMGCDLTLRMATELPEATANVQVAIREVVERLTGLKVIDVSVTARYGRHRDEPVLAR